MKWLVLFSLMALLMSEICSSIYRNEKHIYCSLRKLTVVNFNWSKETAQEYHQCIPIHLVHVFDFWLYIPTSSGFLWFQCVLYLILLIVIKLFNGHSVSKYKKNYLKVCCFPAFECDVIRFKWKMIYLLVGEKLLKSDLNFFF